MVSYFPDGIFKDFPLMYFPVNSGFLVIEITVVSQVRVSLHLLQFKSEDKHA